MVVGAILVPGVHAHIFVTLEQDIDLEHVQIQNRFTMVKTVLEILKLLRNAILNLV